MDDDRAERAIEQVILQMEECLGDELTIDDLARMACFSKFHFSRVFLRVTGLSPGRFLAALRLERAKHLLVSTSLKVIDISHRVGYASVGAFSNRFSRSVGVSPTRYRLLGGFVPEMISDPEQADGRMTISGRILGTPGVQFGPVFVGLFREPLVQGRPAGCVVLSRPGPYQMFEVPRGTWFVLAHATRVPDEDGKSTRESATCQAYVCSLGPIRIRPGSAECGRLDLPLRPKRPVDPPILVALPDFRNHTTG
jgi:AraC family transcriptional regulator